MRRRRHYTVWILLLIAGYSWVAWNLPERHGTAPGTSICLFKTVTGIPCPSCGATRAVTELLRGDFTGSLYLNPLGILLAIGLIVLPLWIAADGIFGNDSFFRWTTIAEKKLSQSRWIVLPAIALAVNWAWNIAKGL